VRVPDVPALAAVRRPVLQSSANLAGGPDARRLADVPSGIREGADLVLDGGELAGTPSTVIDLRAFEADGSWTVVREGLVATASVAARLGTLG
jgi:L-threonylcarbamoyladenylate synthase